MLRNWWMVLGSSWRKKMRKVFSLGTLTWVVEVQDQEQDSICAEDNHRADIESVVCAEANAEGSDAGPRITRGRPGHTNWRNKKLGNRDTLTDIFQWNWRTYCVRRERGQSGEILDLQNEEHALEWMRIHEAWERARVCVYALCVRVCECHMPWSIQPNRDTQARTKCAYACAFTCRGIHSTTHRYSFGNSLRSPRAVWGGKGEGRAGR